MASVLKADCSAADAYVAKTGLNGYATPWWITYELAMTTATATALNGATKNRSAGFHYLADAGNINTDVLVAKPEVAGTGPWDLWGSLGGAFGSGVFSLDTWLTIQIHWDGTTITIRDVDNAVDLNSYTFGSTPYELDLGGNDAWHIASEIYYIKSCVIGSTAGGSNLFSDGFAGGNLSAWSSTHGSVSLVADPFSPAPGVDGRVLIAFDDGPLVAHPTWKSIDQGANSFPANFVSGYDTSVGRQTLLAQTDTGTATVYINDYKDALFDPRNAGSPYFQKLDGRQITLQLYDPVRAVWESQFRGFIDEVTYDIDGSAADANGDPINANVQINCVDVFDYLNGYGLTPGLDGVLPTPAGMEDGVYYAATVGTVDDRIIEILADVGIDTTRSVVFSGNVGVQAVKYDPDESALTALRDACDAEFPFIANMYVDRYGRFCFHGRYGRFDPSGVSADAGTDRWDWHDWNLGDGKAFLADSTRTQIRVLNYLQARNNIVNVSVCYPSGMAASGMPFQVFADTTSITDYGKFAAPPMSDLLTATAIFDSQSATAECLDFAKLLVKNQKDPRVSVSAVQLKSISPTDAKASNVWKCLTQCDISDVVNIKVGYPSGTGLAGASPEDDYFVEGKQMRVRPASSGYDYVELDLEVSPFVWSADTHSVFPPRA